MVDLMEKGIALLVGSVGEKIFFPGIIPFEH